MKKRPTNPAITDALYIDLMKLCQDSTGSGPLWGHESEDLNLTLLSWDSDKSIAPHVNDEVDVVVIVLEGEGEITVKGQIYLLRAGQALLIPKGNERSIRSMGVGFRYLSLHRRRRGIVLNTGGRPALQSGEKHGEEGQQRKLPPFPSMTADKHRI